VCARDGRARPAATTRETAQIGEPNTALDSAEVLERCGSALSSQAVGPKLAWLWENESEVLARARRILMPSSSLAFELTGAFVLDHHSASQCTQMFDAGALSWYRPWVDLIAPGIELPPLLWRGEQFGVTFRPVAGIAAGVPVITGPIDARSEALR